MRVKPTARLAGNTQEFSRPPRRRRTHACALAASAVFIIAFIPPAFADDPSPQRSTFGTIGLVEMPSARMAPDGQLSAGASFFQDTQRYNINFQALPWLETSLRYSGLSKFEPALPNYYVVYWDRSFAAKARLSRETENLPEISIGISDLIGTGVYSSEYLVASKQLGAFDATIGLGWGRLADEGAFKNPFRALSQSFATRPGLEIAGGTNFKVFFRGPEVGIFGGLIYHTPLKGLSVAVEYSSDRYELETQLGQFKPHSQFNYGVTYQLTDSTSLGLDWLYGRSIGGTISFQTDPTQPQYAARIAPQAPPLNVRTPQQQQQAINALLGIQDGGAEKAQAMAARDLDRNAFVDRLFRGDAYSDVEIRGRDLLLMAGGRPPAQPCRDLVDLVQTYDAGVDHIVFESGKGPARQTVRCNVPASLQKAALVSRADAMRGPTDAAAITSIRADAAKQELRIEAVALNESEAIVYYNNGRYFNEDDALNRLILVLMADAPPRIEKFRLYAMGKQEFDVLRAPMERAFSQGSSAEILGNAIAVSRPSLDNPVLDKAERGTYPRFAWDIFPQFRQNFFDPTNPLAVQVVAALDASVEILPGLRLGGEFETNIYENMPDRKSDSLLPHVRSDLPEYLHQGGTGIGNLNLDYHFRIARDLYAAARAGYLESMFAGAGGEVLWSPERQRWALGADVYQVWQRDFNRLFGVQDYHVTTGHVSLYYQSPWYDINFMLRVGRYLAGDHGLTFQATRRFSTGVEIGAFFTKTNVSAERFGEGSFDKGIFIRIPIGWALPIETQGEFAFDLRPLQRDGGQALAGDATLYDEMFRTGQGEIIRHSDSFINP